MESSAVIHPSKSLFFLFFLLWGGLAFPADSPYESFLAALPAGRCQESAKKTSELRLLFSIPQVVTVSPEKGNLVPSFEAWSSDLLIRLASIFDETLTPECGNPRVSFLGRELKLAYLQRLHWEWKEASDPEINQAFRGLIVQKEGLAALAAKIVEKKLENKKPLELFSEVYGGKASELNGVLLLGMDEKEAKRFFDLVPQLCNGKLPCGFWDPRVLYRVNIVSRAGMAAFVPELSILFVSKELLAQKSLLTDVVITHELAHVLQLSLQVRENREVREEFAKVAGWKKNGKDQWRVAVKKEKEKRPDELTRLSVGSPFSILPDSVYSGRGGDGFVLGKSYEESLSRNDPSEDFADSLAILRWVPERYCFKGKPLAPRKEAFLREMVPFKAATPTCEKNPS